MTLIGIIIILEIITAGDVVGFIPSPHFFSSTFLLRRIVFDILLSIRWVEFLILLPRLLCVYDPVVYSFQTILI
jgi:hypothetical protein